MAEANALIGVQKAAYYPTLSITGTVGFEASKFSQMDDLSKPLLVSRTDGLRNHI